MSQIDIFDEIIVDNFAGGGGASTGIELAAGRPVAGLRDVQSGVGQAAGYTRGSPGAEAEGN